MREIEITSKFEVLSATLFEAKDANSVLIIASATGVKQAFYEKFAHYLVNKGVTVITFDYCGIGRSLKRPIKALTNNTESWGKDDLEHVLKYAITNFPKSKKVLLGHSIGGQLIGLARSSTKMDKILLVAAQSGYWKLWNGISRIKMWFIWHVLFPILINLFGYLPSKKINGMENLPKNVANQWGGWCKNKNYILDDDSIEETFYDKIKSELTAISIEDDDFAPQKAVEWLTKSYSNAKIVSTYHLTPSDFKTKKIGHFGIFKDKFENTIWKMLLSEIK